MVLGGKQNYINKIRIGTIQLKLAFALLTALLSNSPFLVVSSPLPSSSLSLSASLPPSLPPSRRLLSHPPPPPTQLA